MPTKIAGGSNRRIWSAHYALAEEVTILEADVVSLAADVVTLQGDVLALQTDVAAMQAATVNYHEPVITASAFNLPGPGKAPTPLAYNSTLLLAFTVGNDEAYRVFKIGTRYASTVGDAAFHVHWTKSTDALETNNAARWRVSVDVFSGSGGQIPTSQVFEVEQTYADPDTTQRHIYRTADTTIPGVTPGYYVGLRVEAVAPSGAALTADPALYSVDVTYPLEVF